MTKLYFDKTLINREVIPNLEKSIKYISFVNNTSLTVPSNFRYGSYLKKVFSNTSEIKNDLLKQKNVMIKSCDEYQSVINNNSRDIESILNVEIPLEKHMIN